MAAQSKENVLTKTNLEDEAEIYSTLKKSVREMKSLLTQGKSEERDSLHVAKQKDNETFFTRKNSDRNKGYYRNRDRNNSYKSRYPERRYSSRDKDNRNSSSNKRHYNDSRSGERPWRRDRNRSQSRGDHFRRNRSKSSRSFSRADSDRKNSSRSNEDSRRGRNKSSSEEEVNSIHLTQYEFQDNQFDKCDSFSDFNNDHDNLELVFSDGNCIIDPYKLVVDSACPKTVTGKSWMDAFIESKDDINIKRTKEKEFFKFSSSKVFLSKENYEIEVAIGKLKEKIKVSVVDADIPLLLGLDGLPRKVRCGNRYR